MAQDVLITPASTKIAFTDSGDTTTVLKTSSGRFEFKDSGESNFVDIYANDIVLDGNLTVGGTTTTVNTSNILIEDPILQLAKGQTSGSPTVDIGFVGLRGDSNNAAFIWDESADQFAAILTTGDGSSTTLTPASYADFKAGVSTFTGNITLDKRTGSLGSAELAVKSSVHSSIVADRNANTNSANFMLRTGGTNKWRMSLGMAGSGNEKFSIYDEANTKNVLTVEPGGNIGIGTDNPNARLKVQTSNTDVAIFQSTHATTANFYLSNNTATANNTSNLYFCPANGINGASVRAIAIEDFSTSANRTADLFFETRKDGTMSEKMRILADGNVGIGLTDPDAKLEIKGTAGSTGLTFKTTDSSSNNTFWIQDGGKAGLHYYPFVINQDSSDTDCPASTFFYVHHATAPFIIKNDGKVGIGTTSPDGKLHVHTASAGSVTADTDRDDLVIENSTNVGLTFLSPNTAKQAIAFGDPENSRMGLITYDHADDSLAFRANNTDNLLKIASNGRSTFSGTTGADGVVIAGGENNNMSSRLFFDNGTAGEAVTILNNSAGMEFRTAGTPGSSSGGVRMYLNSVGNLGIGTNSPAAKLQIVSDGSHDEGAEIFLKHDNNNSTDIVGTVLFGNNAGGVAKIESGTTGANNTGYISFFTDNAGTSSEKMRILGNGNVGIGTSSPTARFNVKASGSTTDQIAVTHSGNTVEIVQLGQSANGNSAGALLLKNNSGTDKVYLDAAGSSYLNGGNVGIGQVSPYGKLDITAAGLGSSSGDVSVVSRSRSDVGSNNMYLLEEYVRTSAGSDWTTSGVRLQAKTDSTYQGYIQFNGDGNNYGIAFGAGAGGTSSPGTTPEKMRIASTGNVSIGSTSSAYGRLFVDAATTAANTALAVRGRDASADYLALNVMNNADSGLFAIYNSGKAYVSGSVGIGTTSPSTYLDVEFSDTTSYASGNGNSRGLDITNAATDNNTQFASLQLATLNNTNGTGSLVRIHAINENSTAGASSMAFTTRNASSTISEKMRIQGDGNVGIGTDNPGYKLDIGGVDSSVNNTIRLNQDNGGTAIRIGAGGGSSDVTLLRVDGESSAGNHDGATDSSEYGFSLRYMGARSGNANSLSIFSDNQNAASQIEAVTIYQDGNVGIGTTSPTTRLHVVGNTVINGDLFFGSTSGSFVTTSSSNLRLAGDNGVKLQTYSGGWQDRLTVIDNGSVGIGTTSPTALLHVNGSIKVERSLIGISNSSLTRIEQFILDSSGEDLPVINYQLNNDLALLRVKGNTVTYSGLSSNPGDSETDRFFESNSYFGDIAASEISNASTGFTITLDSLPRNLTYTTRIGISFAAPQWRCSYVKIEVYRAGAWTQIREETSNTKATVWQYYNTGSSAVTKIRYTIKTPVTTSTRIVSLFAFNYNSTGNSGYFLSQAGGTVYGPLTLGANAFTFPTTDGSANQVLQTDGSGTLSWSSAGTGTISGSGTDNYIPRFNGTGALENSIVYDTGSTLSLGSTSPHAVGGTSKLYLTGQTNMIVMSQSNVFNNSSYIRHWSTAHFQWQTYNGSNAGSIEIQPYGGNVGIGTGGSTPDGVLNVKSSGDGVNVLDLVDSSGDALFNVRQSGNNGMMRLYADGGAEKIRLRSSGLSFFTGGSVGIGTTAPVKDVDVKYSSNNSADIAGSGLSGATAGNGVLINNTATNVSSYANLDFRANNADGRIAYRYDAANKGSFHFVTDNDGGGFVNAMSIRSDGNVGIGATTPAAHLHVSKSAGTTTVLTQVAANSTVGYEIKKTGSTTQHWKIVDGQTVNGTLEFYDATDSATRMAINGSGSVGIGTTSPTRALHVVGGVYVPSGASGFGTGDTTALVNILGTGANNATSALRVFRQGGDELLRTYNDGMVTMGMIGTANVGIGTATPAAKLEVAGNLNLETSGGDVGLWLHRTDAREYRLYVDSNGLLNLRDQDAGGTRIAVKTDGNVGIGTTSPGDKLHVNGGAAIFEDDGNNINIKNTWSSGNHDINFIGGSSSGGAASNTAARIRVLATAPGGAATGSMQFTVNSGDTFVDAMRILSSGSVGIGTTSPSYPLQVQYAGGAAIGMQVKGTSNRAKLVVTDNDTSAYVIAEDSYASFGRNDSLNANNLNINSNGSVGIGTSSPSQALSVFQGKIGVSDAYMIGNLDGNTGMLTYSSNRVTWEIGGSEKMRLNSAGKLLINDTATTNNNNAQLYVNGPVYGSEFDLPSGGRLDWGNGDARITEGLVTNYSLSLSTYDGSSAQVTNLFLKSGGYVGVGTTSPGGVLHVNGASGAGWDRNIVLSMDGTTLGKIITDSDGLKYRTIVSGDGHYFRNAANNTTLLIQDNGRVGIGTTSPQTTLHSSGTIRVGTSPFTDYKTSQQYSSASYYVAMATGSFHIANQANTAKFTFTPSTGKFGIGITSPNETADVIGSIKYGTNSDHEIVYHSTTSTIAGDTLTTINWKNGTTTLDRTYTYKIELYVNNDTSTNASAVYVLRDTANYASDTVAWSLRMVSRTGTSSNHVAAVVTATSTVIQVKHFHPSSSYPIGYKVTANKRGSQNAVGAAIFGADSMWQRDVSNLQYPDGQVQVLAGAVSAPSYSFTGDVDTGMSHPTTNALNFVTGGSERVRIDPNGVMLVGSQTPSGNAAQRFQVGTVLASSSSAIAQIGGLLRTSYIITHASGTAATAHSGVQPASNNTGNLGNTAYRYYGLYSNIGNFTGNLTLAGDSASRFYFGNKLAMEGQISNNNLDLGENFANIRLRSSSDVFPTNSVNLGTSSSRWTTIYGVAGNFSGNVGIGATPNAANKLEVNGQIRSTTAMFGDASLSNVAAKPVHIKVGGAAMLRLEDSTSSNLVYDISSDWGIGFVIRDETAGTNRLIIDQSTGDATFSNDVIVTGDLTVNGDTTTVNTANLLVEDPLIVLAKNQTGTPTLDAGLIIERGDYSNAGLIYDESADEFAFMFTDETGSTAGNTTISSYAALRVGSITESSSIAIKENIFDFTSPLEKISKVRPVKYNRKTSKDKKEIGLIAEELAEIFPELVENDKDGNPTSVNYTRAVTVLFDGFKQMYKELKEIKEKIK